MLGKPQDKSSGKHLQQGISLLSRSDALSSWDTDHGRAMKMAETMLHVGPKKCAWSPYLRNVALIRKYWKLRLREAKENLNYRQTFYRWQQKIQTCDPNFVFPPIETKLLMDVISSNLTTANRAFRKTQNKAMDLRLLTCEQLIVQYLEDDNPMTREKSLRKRVIVQRTIDSEINREVFRNLRQVIKPIEHSALSKVEVPRPRNSFNTDPAENSSTILESATKDNIEWDTIIDREDMERHLLTFNRAVFKAAAKSPCGTMPSFSPVYQKNLKDYFRVRFQHHGMATTHFSKNFLLLSQFNRLF